MKIGKYFGGVSGFFLIMLMIGCVTTTRVAIKPEYQANLHSAEILVRVISDEIFEKPGSSTASGGLVQAISGAIDDYYTEKGSIDPICERLVGYDYRADLMNALESYEYKVDWLRDRKIEYIGGYFSSEDLRERSRKSGSAIVRIYSNCYLINGLNDIEVESRISVFLPGTGDTKPIYKNTFYYREHVYETQKSEPIDFDVKANNVRNALSRSHNQIMAMFEYDVLRLESEKTEENQKNIRTEGDIIWTRNGMGELLAVNSGKQVKPTGRLASPHHVQKQITPTITLPQDLVFRLHSVVDKRQYIESRFTGKKGNLIEDKNLEGWLPSALISLSECKLKIVPHDNIKQNNGAKIDVEILKAYFRRARRDIITLALRVVVKDDDKIILDKTYREQDRAINAMRWSVTNEHVETGFTNALKKIIDNLQGDLFLNSEI